MISRTGQRVVGRAGFTLIELLVVSVLIVLLSGATLRVSMRMHQRMLVESKARQVYMAAKYARLFAVEQQRACRLVLNRELGNFCVMGRLGAQAQETPLSNPFTRPGQLDAGVEFEKIAIIPSASARSTDESEMQTVYFLPDGTADGAVLQIGNGTTHYSICISPATGRAQVVQGTLDQAPIDIVDLDGGQ